MLESLGLEPGVLDDAIEFLTAHDLIRKVYRYGTTEMVNIQVLPGRIIPMAKAVSPAKDADPSDTRYGVDCFQITERGMAIVNDVPTQPAAGPIVAFSSYCHADEKYRKRLDTHLSLLKRQGLIAAWSDHKITAGKELDVAIREQLERAAIVLLLISPDFIASEYCYNVELKRAIERHEAGTARVIPIIIRPCDWYSAPFGKLKALPKDGKAITKWRSQDEAFLDIARGIREVVDELSTRQEPTQSPDPATLGGAQADDDKVVLAANLSITGYRVQSIGCPCLDLRLVCTSKRPAKIQGATLRIRGSQFISAFQRGYGRDFGYKPPQGKPDPNDSLGFYFIPASPQNSPNGFIIERDDACKFFLPALGIPLPLLADSPPEDVSVVVDYIDGRKETVLEGLAVHGQIQGLYEMCSPGRYSLKSAPTIIMNLDVRSATPPDMSGVGAVNQNPVVFTREAGCEDTPPGPKTEMDVFDDFPEIMAIGREALQGLCNEWLKTSIAKQSRVMDLAIGQRGAKLTIANLQLEAPPGTQPGEHLHFPLDYLLNYLIERVAPPDQQERLKGLVESKRSRGGLAVYQRFVVAPRRPLAVKCKNPACCLVLRTTAMGYQGQPFLTDIEPVVCPRCSVSSTYEPEDFFEFPVP